jgi:hypothetical protein
LSRAWLIIPAEVEADDDRHFADADEMSLADGNDRAVEQLDLPENQETEAWQLP